MTFGNATYDIPYSAQSVYTILMARPDIPASEREAARLYSPFLYFSEIFDTAAAMRAVYERFGPARTDPLRQQELLDILQANIVRLFQAGDARTKIEIAGKVVSSAEILQWIAAPSGQPRLTFQPIAAELAALMRRFASVVPGAGNDPAISGDRRYFSRLANIIINAAANALAPAP